MNDEGENKEIIFFIFTIPVKIEIDLELQRKRLTHVKYFFSFCGRTSSSGDLSMCYFMRILEEQNSSS